MSIEEQQRIAAQAAARLVESGMCVGLGTGSTAKHLIIELGQRLQSGELTRVTGVPTSRSTEALATKVGIPLVELGDKPIDFAIDGADAIAPDLSLIKGAGGALLREKIVAAAAREFVVVADKSKLVERLGADHPVPVEIAEFGYLSTMASLRGLGDAQLRTSGNNVFTTDNGNLIVDLRVHAVPDPAEFDRTLTAVPGVFASGLFYDIVTLALVADENTVRELRATGPS